ncbi:MAG: hypothetical protein OQJ98_02060 [Candidatus Pacebacteria bacterium]|nr:hypothetical protein [Candidatus Paceibacterota bacterium]
MIPLSSTLHKESFPGQLADALVEVAKNIQKNGLVEPGGKKYIIPREIVCVLGSPWHQTQTITASVEQKESFLVTDAVMDNLLAQIQEKKEKDEREGAEEMVTIEEMIIESSLNGYSTQSPIGKTARCISVAFLESSTFQATEKLLRKALYEVFSPSIPLAFRSFTLASFSVVRDILSPHNDFLLIDVTGGTSNISVVHNSILLDTANIPYGRNTLIQNITKATGAIPEESLSRVKLFFAGGDDQELQELIGAEEERWLKHITEACKRLSFEAVPLPSKVFVISDPVFGSWFKTVLESPELAQFTVTKKHFEAILISEKSLEEKCSFERSVQKDVFLMTDALFYSREYGAHQ